MNTGLLAGGALALLAVTASAQATGITMTTRAGRVEATTTATALFVVRNASPDTAPLMPHVDVPPGWTVLTGTSTLRLAPGTGDVLLLSVAVPARARAGVYPVRLSLTTPELFSLVTDSMLVVVPERRGVQVELLERPSYTIAPRAYEAVFLVRNRGNVPAALQLSAKSRLGAVDLAGNQVVALEPDEARSVRVRVRPRTQLRRADNDIVELLAQVVADSTQSAMASARVTVVPEPVRFDAFERLPGQLRLRTASTAGVAPFEIAGGGALREGSGTQLDFLMRSRGRTTGVFAEDDEYRVELTTPSWNVRVGDHLFALSPLTAAGRPGAGVGGELTREAWSAGGFVQRFRRDSLQEGEAAAFASIRPFGRLLLGINAVSRESRDGPVSLFGAQTSLHHRGDRIDVELVRTSGPKGPGVAANGRLTGVYRRFVYDAGVLNGDSLFAGTQAGARNAYAAASLRPTRRVGASVSASSRSHVVTTSGATSRFRLDLASASVTLDQRLTAELAVARRPVVTSASPVIPSDTEELLLPSHQRSIRLRADQRVGPLALSLGGTRGVTIAADAHPRAHGDVHATARLNNRLMMISGFFTLTGGGSLINGPDGLLTAGGDASFRLRRTLDVSSSWHSTRSTGDDPRWRSYFDARLHQTLRNGSSLTYRVRVATGDATALDRSGMFLEYGMPLRLPMSRSRGTGRVQGRIVDAESGRGISNALVRVGGQVAITDQRGQVTFSNVSTGPHRVSLAQEQSLTDAVFIGDPTLHVDGTSTRPTSFQLRLARGARIDVAVNRFAPVRTALDGGPDSLALMRPEANVTLRLVNGRDTIFRHSNDQGRASFTDVPPGKWVLAVHSEAPPRHQFEPDRVEIMLAPGENREVELRVVPSRRGIQVIGGDQELRSMPKERSQRGNDRR